ncbi:MAG TPA: hypothetical protein VFB75_22130 [Burkholderiales bacterium]|nr:hypothetical protein [Burkholderiales bacterium]
MSDIPNKVLGDLGDELAKKLGHAIWAFARIEWTTYEFLIYFTRTHDEMRLLPLLNEMSFEQRTAALRKLIDQYASGTPEAKKAKGLIEDAKELAKMRNVLAHNPWTTWINQLARTFSSSISKRTDQKKNLTEAEVKQFAVDADKLGGELLQALQAVAAIVKKNWEQGREAVGPEPH